MPSTAGGERPGGRVGCGRGASSGNIAGVAERFPCAAGRSAFFGGQWAEPCPEKAIHHIGPPGADPIRLCDGHFIEVNAAGLVTDPNLDEDEFQRRERERLNAQAGEPPRPRRRWFGRQ